MPLPEIYAKRIRGRIERALIRAFPLTHHILTKDQWDLLLEAFLSEGIMGPVLWKMPETFAKFVQNGDWKNLFQLPYLDDLLSFEWLEIEIYMMPDCERENKIVPFSYPVFEKKPLPRPMQKGSYFLFAYRHPDTKKVHFVSLSSFYVFVLELIQNEDIALKEALVKGAQKFNLDESKALSIGTKFFEELYNQKGILRCAF